MMIDMGLELVEQECPYGHSLGAASNGSRMVVPCYDCQEMYEVAVEAGVASVEPSRKPWAYVTWESWRLDLDRYCLVHDDPLAYYEVDVEACFTSGQVLDWIMQVSGKIWASPDVLSGLVHALNDILDPQRTLCSFGSQKSLTAQELRDLMNDARGRSVLLGG